MINSFDDCKRCDNLIIYCRIQTARQLLVTLELPDEMQVGRCVVLSTTDSDSVASRFYKTALYNNGTFCVVVDFVNGN